mmetsp:Transcript_39613/g.99211  ORF Transcript_39613/g.99211 Transcript_39613/m.99211 type:complete len:205 (+) Transcript_39613:137-751(+)
MRAYTQQSHAQQHKCLLSPHLTSLDSKTRPCDTQQQRRQHKTRRVDKRQDMSDVKVPRALPTTDCYDTFHLIHTTQHTTYRRETDRHSQTCQPATQSVSQCLAAAVLAWRGGCSASARHPAAAMSWWPIPLMNGPTQCGPSAVAAHGQHRWPTWWATRDTSTRPHGGPPERVTAPQEALSAEESGWMARRGTSGESNRSRRACA